MKQEGKVILGILLIVVLFFYGSELFSVFQPSTQNFIQYTEVPICSGSVCSFFTSSQLASKTVEINTGKNIFRFESEVEDIVEKKVCKTLSQLCSASSIGSGVPTYVDSDGCQHWKFTYRSIKNWGYYRDPCGSPSSGADCYVGWDGSSCATGDRYGGYYCGVCWGGTQVIEDYGGAYISTTNSEGLINRACYQKIKVYKNNQLIDTLYSESTMGEDSGIYYNEVSDSGVRVDMQSSWFETSVCSAYQNAYELMFPSDALIIDVSSPKEEYLQGEPIEIEVNIVNNLNINTNGELIINYEVPTIFGTKTKTVSQDIEINTGNNIFTYSIPTDEPLSVLRVKPKLIINYPTAEIDGVNYNFKGEVVNIKSQSDFVIGSVEEEWSEIQVTSLAGYYQEQLELTEEELALLNISLQEKLLLLEQYSGDLDTQILLISQMELTLSEKIILVSTLTDKIDEQIAITNALNLDIAAQNIMIQELTDNLAEKLIWLDQLQITTEEQGILLVEMRLNFADQAFILDNLNNTVQEDAIIIKNLNLNLQDTKNLLSELERTNDEMAELIISLNLNLDESAVIIAGLKLSLSEEQELVSQLVSEIEEQNELLELLRQEKKFNIENVWKDYKIAIIISGALLFLIIIRGKRK